MTLSVHGVGRLCSDPEDRRVGNTTKAMFRMAFNRRYKNSQSGQTEEKVTFVDVEAWGRDAEIVMQYLRKGDLFYLQQGRLDMDTWQDNQSGQNRSKLYVTIERLRLLPRGDGQQQSGNGNGGGRQQQQRPPQNQQRQPQGGRPRQQRQAPPQQNYGNGFDDEGGNGFDDPQPAAGPPPGNDEDIPF